MELRQGAVSHIDVLFRNETEAINYAEDEDRMVKRHEGLRRIATGWGIKLGSSGSLQRNGKEVFLPAYRVKGCGYDWRRGFV